jgi:hypothetical protein
VGEGDPGGQHQAGVIDQSRPIFRNARSANGGFQGRADEVIESVEWVAHAAAKATEAATAAPRRIAGAPTHGYKATREAAMAAFAKSWRRE